MSEATKFAELKLSPAVMAGIEAVGYENPSPIQARIIPLILAGKDVIGQAQTGTGKTAAFALPLLSNLDLAKKAPQVLVLTPTRELAIQVAEAFKKYAAGMKGFHVQPIYGGADYRSQFIHLERGIHVVVGTPGRVMDHIGKGTLKLDALQCLVLDEADEMLQMGFLDDVEWILEQTPESRQVALFSATMPHEIKRIAEQHLDEPVEVLMKEKTATAATIEQRYVLVHASHKLEALTRILEVEATDGVIIFVRTKIATVELAERLEARGHAAAALSGDVPQKQREATVAKLKAGAFDILVATDVAARGLDIERVSHVINYDVPYDSEAYVHRIGRTGRAGRAGAAILFLTPRERRMLPMIERATRSRIAEMPLPSADAIADKRLTRFHAAITKTLAEADLEAARGAVEAYLASHEVEPLDLAAALAEMLRGEGAPAEDIPVPRMEKGVELNFRDRQRHDQGKLSSTPFSNPRQTRDRAGHRERRPREGHGPPTAMETYRLEVGSAHGAKAGNILGAIANEANLTGRDIGRIELHEDYSTVDLPQGMPKAMFQHLKKVRVAGRPLNLSLLKPGGKG